MIQLISFAIIGIEMFFAYFNPLIFLVIYGIAASPYEGYGIMSLLTSVNPYYSLCMNLLLIITAILSIVKKNRLVFSEKDKTPILLTIILIIHIFFSLCVGYMQGKNFSILLSLLTDIIYQTPIYLIILLQNKHKYDVKRYFLIYLKIQILIAFLSIYLPTIGIHILDPILSINYMQDDIARLHNHGVAMIDNFYNVFTNKYMFNNAAHFHNANDTGFYGGVGLFVFGYILFRNNRKKNKKICSIILNSWFMFMSACIWCNSGMRGPILGIVVGMVIYIACNKSISKRVINIILFLSVLLVGIRMLISVVDIDVFNEFIKVSLSGRETLRNSGYEFIGQHILWGNNGVFTGLGNVDPHELPIRIAVLFGILASVIIIWIVYVLPIKKICKIKKNMYKIVLYSIVIAVSLTNNYTCIVLFYFLLMLSAYDVENISRGKNSEKNLVCK